MQPTIWSSNVFGVCVGFILYGPLLGATFVNMLITFYWMILNMTISFCLFSMCGNTIPKEWCCLQQLWINEKFWHKECKCFWVELLSQDFLLFLKPKNMKHIDNSIEIEWCCPWNVCLSITFVLLILGILFCHQWKLQMPVGFPFLYNSLWIFGFSMNYVDCFWFLVVLFRLSLFESKIAPHSWSLGCCGSSMLICVWWQKPFEGITFKKRGFEILFSSLWWSKFVGSDHLVEL